MKNLNIVISPRWTHPNDSERRIHSLLMGLCPICHTFFVKIAVSVYKNGLTAELIGRTMTAVQAYTSLGITWSVIASMPMKKKKRKKKKKKKKRGHKINTDFAPILITCHEYIVISLMYVICFNEYFKP